MYWHDTTSVTEQFGAGFTHQVHDTHLGPTEGTSLRTACGRSITPAPLTAPLGRPCPACAARLTGRRQERPDTTGRRLGGLRRLLGR